MSEASKALRNMLFYLLYDMEELSNFESQFEELCPDEHAKYLKYMEDKEQEDELKHNGKSLNHLEELLNYMYYNEDDFGELACHVVYDYYIYRKQIGTIHAQEPEKKDQWKFVEYQKQELQKEMVKQLRQ